MSGSRRVLGFLGFIAVGILVIVGLIFQGRLQGQSRRMERQQIQVLVRNLALTDLCLTTEARYTRHPSQADRHSAFQDHPLALEHFPSGTLIRPSVPVRPVR